TFPSPSSAGAAGRAPRPPAARLPNVFPRHAPDGLPHGRLGDAVQPSKPPDARSSFGNRLASGSDFGLGQLVPGATLAIRWHAEGGVGGRVLLRRSPPQVFGPVVGLHAVGVRDLPVPGRRRLRADEGFRDQDMNPANPGLAALYDLDEEVAAVAHRRLE